MIKSVIYAFLNYLIDLIQGIQKAYAERKKEHDKNAQLIDNLLKSSNGQASQQDAINNIAKRFDDK